MKKILVTGANGFVGQRLCAFLAKRNYVVKAAVRDDSIEVYESPQVEKIIIGALENPGFLTESGGAEIFSDVGTVVHLASRVHMMHETSQDPLAEYRKVNVEATRRLAQSAAKSGVRRFVYLSSVKVNGEYTVAEKKFNELDFPDPQDAYGQSKWEAEQVLHEIAKSTGLEVVIIRSPLVYGKGVKANFQKLVQLIKSGWPIPLGAVKNSRSLIYVDNLVDAILVCMHHERARNQTYLVSDGDDVSTLELIHRLSKTLHKPERLLPVSPILLRWAGRLTGKQASVERLLSSLCVDNHKICSELTWQPPYKMEEAFYLDFSDSNAPA